MRKSVMDQIERAELKIRHKGFYSLLLFLSTLAWFEFCDGEMAVNMCTIIPIITSLYVLYRVWHSDDDVFVIIVLGFLTSFIMIVVSAVINWPIYLSIGMFVAWMLLNVSFIILIVDICRYFIKKNNN